VTAQDEVALLARLDALDALRLGRNLVRESFGVEVQVVGPGGPLPHQQGGVMTGSSEACRTMLFSPNGFRRCDASYRALGTGGDEERLVECPFGLRQLSVPVTVDGEVVAHLVASGFAAPSIDGGSYDPTRLAHALAAADPSLVDPSAAVRAVPVLRGSAVKGLRGALRVLAEELGAHEQGVRLRQRSVGGLPGRWGIVGASPAMREVFTLLERVMPTSATVLITGESGTGKELVARALHAHGPRAAGPWVAANCGAFAEDVLESTLFGHVRGAFSGARRAATGLFGAAHGGTLFLDEVGEMSPALQVKLLRVLQDGTYLPVGGVEPRRVDVRVVAATHRDLGAMVEAGAFRRDLYYRLHVVEVRLPPLRDRLGDLRPLLTRFMAELDGVPARISDEAWACLERYEWPGNVRELAAEAARWQVTAQGAAELLPVHLSEPVRNAGGFWRGRTTPRGAAVSRTAAAEQAPSGITAATTASTPAPAAPAGLGGATREGEAVADRTAGDALPFDEAERAVITRAFAGDATLDEAVAALERALVIAGLRRTRGNRARLARELAISRTTLHARLSALARPGEALPVARPERRGSDR
jgi:DNA-binding NtrC family response regulator